MADRISANDPLIECASIRRDELQKVDFEQKYNICDATGLEIAWRNIVIPESIILDFLNILLHFNKRQ